MKIKFKNLGIVKESSIDLEKDLIILSGPNNAGKTYVAYSVYGISKTRVPITLASRLLKNLLTPIFDKGFLEINLTTLLSNNLPTISDLIKKSFVNSVDRIFACSNDFFTKLDIEVTLNESDIVSEKKFGRGIERKIGFQNQALFQLSKPPNSAVLSCIYVLHTEKKDVSTPSKEDLLYFLSNSILEILLDFIFPRVYITPAERIAINLFSKELSLQRNILVDKLLELKKGKDSEDPFDIVNRRASRYPLPIRDSLEIAEDLLVLQKRKSKHEDLAFLLEQSILKGKIQISRDGEMLFIPEKAKTKKLSIHMTASAVKSWANLVFYFRHLASDNDFIIIDEPELNLHPDNQRKVARFLAQMVNRGFKVLVSTHSDYIVREINNLIMLKSELPEAKRLREKYSYDTNELLDHKRLGVYLFNYHNRIASSIDVFPYGFNIDSIDEVINEQNQSSQDIYYTLFD